MLLRIAARLGIACLSLSTLGCKVEYNTELQNATGTSLTVELVNNYQPNATTQPCYPCEERSTYTSTADQHSLREACKLAPGQTMYIGREYAYFSVVPLDADTLLVRTTDGVKIRITPDLLGSLITDTTHSSHGVEGQPFVMYTIQLR